MRRANRIWHLSWGGFAGCLLLRPDRIRQLSWGGSAVSRRFRRLAATSYMASELRRLRRVSALLSRLGFSRAALLRHPGLEAPAASANGAVRASSGHSGEPLRRQDRIRHLSWGGSVGPELISAGRCRHLILRNGLFSCRALLSALTTHYSKFFLTPGSTKTTPLLKLFELFKCF